MEDNAEEQLEMDLGEELEATEEPQEKVNLTVEDIKMCAEIIDLCAKRGAFSGAEMASVGILRNRIVAYLSQ